MTNFLTSWVDQVDIVRRNLVPHLHTALALHEIHTIDELIQLGRRIEHSYWPAKQYCPPTSNSRSVTEPELAYHRSVKHSVRETSAVQPTVSSKAGTPPVASQGPVC